MLSTNNGCRWMEFLWNGITTLVMENDIIRLEILVDKGTDIVEFLYKPADIDFMWRSPMPVYKPFSFVTTMQGELGNFLDYYPGGWQEVFPNGGVPCKYKGASLGLHGEVALQPWKYSIIEDTVNRLSIRFSTRTYRTSFFLEKTISIKSNSPEVIIDEKITNWAGEDMDFIWGHHPAIGKPFLSSDCIIRIKGAKVAVGQGDGKSFTNLKQTTGIWPLVEGLNSREKVDISICPSENDRVSEVMFLSDLEEGQYEIFNEKLGLGFKLEFPSDIFRYIWFWRVAKGSFNYPWYGRTYNIALEPFSSLPNLTEAVKRGSCLTLKPGENLLATLKASVTTG
jgi:galactose mutarotase-like enzyme